MNIVFVPLYIKYIGIEAYGLIGLFAVMQTWLSLLDMGTASTLNREMGRFTGGAQSPGFIRDLLRSVEAMVVIIACLITFGIWASAGWLASEWLQAEDLPVATVEQALSIMGVVFGLQFVSGIYRSSLIGLQKQVLFNAINAASATIRGLGALAVLAWFSPTIEAFVIWQLVIAGLTFLILMVSTYACLPAINRRGRLSLQTLKQIGGYAGGALGIAFLSLLLTQIDKVLLSRLLTLSEYGHYMLAFLVASGLSILLLPIVQTWFPRLSQLHAGNDNSALIKAYHEGAQLVSVIVGSATVALIIFAEDILWLWTQNEELAKAASGLVRVLAFGNLLNSFLTMPYLVQLAYGWTGFALRVNALSVALIVPAIFWAVPEFGAMGAAWIWVGLNVGYMSVGAYFMYRRILTAEKWRWYRNDIAYPMLSASAMAGLLLLIIPETNSHWIRLIEIILASCMILVSAACGAPNILKLVYSSIFLNRRQEVMSS